MTRVAKFTERQREVVRALARGMSAEEVGVELGISARSAKAHADVLRGKLGVEKRRQIPEAFMRVTGEDPFPRPGGAS